MLMGYSRYFICTVNVFGQLMIMEVVWLNLCQYLSGCHLYIREVQQQMPEVDFQISIWSRHTVTKIKICILLSHQVWESLKVSRHTDQLAKPSDGCITSKYSSLLFDGYQLAAHQSPYNIHCRHKHVTLSYSPSNSSGLAWHLYGEMEENHEKLRIASNLDKIQTGYLSSTSLRHYCYTCLLTELLPNCFKMWHSSSAEKQLWQKLYDEIEIKINFGNGCHLNFSSFQKLKHNSYHSLYCFLCLWNCEVKNKGWRCLKTKCWQKYLNLREICRL